MIQLKLTRSPVIKAVNNANDYRAKLARNLSSCRFGSDQQHPPNQIFKTFYIKPNERGILYNRSDFKAILEPGIHRYFGWNWRVITYDLNQPEVQIDYLELLLQTDRAKLEQHLTIVKTEFDRVALLQIGQTWITVEPNQLRTFWKGFIPVKVDYFNLTDNIELPAALVEKHGILPSAV